MSLLPADYRAQWLRIRPGLEAALAHQREGLCAEDVYAALKAGRAQLYCAADGFLILRLERHGETGATVLFIWFGWCEGGDAIARYKDEVMELARDLDASEVAFCSTRRGFERALPEGWLMQYVRWYRRI